MQLDGGHCVILKNRKQLGTLVKHRIKKRDIETVYKSYTEPNNQYKSPLDELRDSSGGKKNRLIEELPSTTKTPLITEITPPKKYRLVLTEAQDLLAEFYLPQVRDLSDVQLDTDSQSIQVYVPKYRYLIDEFLPQIVDIDRTTAEWLGPKKVCSKRVYVRNKSS